MRLVHTPPALHVAGRPKPNADSPHDRSHTAHTGDLHLDVPSLVHTPRPARRPKPNADSPHDVELLSSALAPHHFLPFLAAVHGDHTVWLAVCVCIRSRPRCTWMPDHVAALGNHTRGRSTTHHRSSHVLVAPSATEPSLRMKGCFRPRLTASCCCCCDLSLGVRVHTAHDDAPNVVSLHSHFPHLKPGPGVGPWVRVRSAAYRPQYTHAKTHADATAEKSDEKENTDYDQRHQTDQLVGVRRGRGRRWADRSATVRA